MAKQSRKYGVQKNRQHQSAHIEETFDDSLLPDSVEIAKLKELDPNIVEWLKDRAAKEQDFRHSVFKEKITMVGKVEKGDRAVNYLALCLSFILLMSAMSLSAFLIYCDEILTGTIFAGATIAFVVSLYLSKVKSNNAEKTPKK